MNPPACRYRTTAHLSCTAESSSSRDVLTLSRPIFLVLPNQAQVVEYPVGSPRCGGDQVSLMHAKVSDWSNRQIQLKRRPALSPVPRNKQTKLSPGKEKILSNIIFTYDTRECIVRQSIGDLCPGVAVVSGFV